MIVGLTLQMGRAKQLDLVLENKLYGRWFIPVRYIQ